MEPMKISLELDEGKPSELILRVPRVDEEVLTLQRQLLQLLGKAPEIALSEGEREIFVPVSDLLFFETMDGNVYAHTATACYKCQRRLYELESLLPSTFVRASKAALVNIMEIRTMSRSLTGVGEITFRNSDKRMSVSRMYYQGVRDRVEEVRLKHGKG
ncbi:MAG: LytTR family transcriptional regulator [Clostridia bacterium]|nr:LytTR family transcriptional regulator [Clostridia bacterium]